VAGPFSAVNMLLAGYDADVDECSLFFIDYMASMQKVNSGGQGLTLVHLAAQPQPFCH
jgi:20S proteasome subunit beta 4